MSLRFTYSLRIFCMSLNDTLESNPDDRSVTALDKSLIFAFNDKPVVNYVFDAYDNLVNTLVVSRFFISLIDPPYR